MTEQTTKTEQTEGLATRVRKAVALKIVRATNKLGAREIEGLKVRVGVDGEIFEEVLALLQEHGRVEVHALGKR